MTTKNHRYRHLADGNPGSLMTLSDHLHRIIEWEDWDEDNTELKTVLALKAMTYKPPEIFALPPCHRWERHYSVSPGGSFAYRNDIMVGFTMLGHFKDAGFTIWNGNVVLPMLIDMNRSFDSRRFNKRTSEYRRTIEGAVWMSLTPAEMLSQRSGVKKAQGKVLVGGLGLGWFLRKVCEKSTVEQVVVVEKSQELIDWYGDDLCRKQPKVTDVICDDVFAVAEQFPEHQLLLDIWPVFRGRDSAEADRRLSELRTKAGDRVWAWGMD